MKPTPTFLIILATIFLCTTSGCSSAKNAAPAEGSIEEFLLDNDMNLDDLSDLDIYPALKEIQNTDKKFYIGLLKKLNDPKWKYTSISGIGYFYQTDSLQLSIVAEKFTAQLHNVSETVGLSPDEAKNLKINVFIIPSSEWDIFLSQARSFYLSPTSQIYLQDLPTWCIASTITHEQTHLIFAQKWPGKEIPLWLNEGLAYALEHPACFEYNHRDVWGPFQKDVQNGKIGLLKDIVSIDKKSFTMQRQNVRFYFTLNFLASLIGWGNMDKFIDNYLSSKAPDFQDLLNSINLFTSGAYTERSLQKTFEEYRIPESPKPPSDPSNALSFESTAVDLGTFRLKTPFSYTFQGKNETGRTLRIIGVTGKCDAAPLISRTTIPPGKTTDITIQMISQKKTGDFIQSPVLKIDSYTGIWNQTLTVKARITQ